MNKKVISYLLLSTLYLLLPVNRVWSACANLYCHGGASGLSWTGTLTGECSACHASFGAGNTLSWGPAIAEKIHKKHTSTTTIVNGSGEGYGFACDQCHTRYGGDTITHAEGQAYQVSNGSAAAEIKFYLIADGLTERTTNYGTSNVFMRFVSLSSNPYTGGSANPQFAYSASTIAADGVNGGYFGISVSSCNNVWCHSNANPAGGSNQYVKVATGPVTCTSCHAGPGTGGGTNLSLAHSTHTRTNSYNYKCYYCHEQTVVSESTYTIKYSSHHVNGTKTIDLSTHNPNGYFVDSATSCYNTYCHSNAITVWKGGTSLSTVTWTSAGTVNCGSCHGNGSANGIPNYANGSPKPNSHDAHSNFGCQKCHYPTTSNGTTITGFKQHVTSTYTVTAGDGASFGYQFKAIAQGTGTCSGISCHGGNYAVWGATLTCYDCHISTNDVDDYIYQNGTGTVALISTDSVKGWFGTGHGRQSGSSYDSGNPAANFVTAGSTQCYYCHDPSIGHNVSTNPFRLANINNATYGRNYNCLICHDSQGPGVADKDATPDVTKSTFTAHWGAKHSTETAGSGTTDGGLYCWDCHDPHGDYDVANSTGVSYMAQLLPVELTKGTTYTTNAYGVPYSTFGITAFYQGKDGQPGYAWGDYIEETMTSPNGICQRCHDSTVKYFNQSSSSTHNSGTPCIQCHKHDNNFAGAGCNACHGGNTGTSENRSIDKPDNWWPDGSTRTTPGGGLVADRAGAHEEHVLAIANRRGWYDKTQRIANQQEICKYCHGQTIPPTSHYSGGDNEPATLFGAGLSTSSTEGFRKLDSSSTLGSVDNGTYTFTAANNPRYCDNLDCHWNRQTPVTGLGWYAVDGSSKPAVATCGACHQDTAISGSSWPTTGAHEKHTRSGSGENYGYACEKCHASSSYQLRTTASTDTHNNNKVNWSFADIGTAFKSSFTAEAYSYTSGFDLGTSTIGTCSNLYCHGLQTTPQWNQTWASAGITDKCSACHQEPPTTGAGLYAHTVHNSTGATGLNAVSTPTAYNYGCGICHYASNPSGFTLDTSQHAQGKFSAASSQTARVEFYDSLVGVGASYTSSTTWWCDTRGFQFTAGRCNSAYCHGVNFSSGTRVQAEDVTVSTPNWNVNLAASTSGGEQNIACGSCHNLFKSESHIHKQHIGGVSGSVGNYTFDCADCHRNVDNNPWDYKADISSRTAHVNNDYDINFSSYIGGSFVPGQ